MANSCSKLVMVTLEEALLEAGGKDERVCEGVEEVEERGLVPKREWVDEPDVN